tara:strand:+ start:1401 stop:1622 length:222 start_codon:yes stop_codon:yes gene_type:complete
MIKNIIKNNINNNIYIDCFYYSFYIEKNELIKYKNKENEVAINTLINTCLEDNILTKVNTFSSLTDYFNKLSC